MLRTVQGRENKEFEEIEKKEEGSDIYGGQTWNGERKEKGD